VFFLSSHQDFAFFMTTTTIFFLCTSKANVVVISFDFFQYCYSSLLLEYGCHHGREFERIQVLVCLCVISQMRIKSIEIPKEDQG